MKLAIEIICGASGLLGWILFFLQRRKAREILDLLRRVNGLAEKTLADNKRMARNVFRCRLSVIGLALLALVAWRRGQK